VVALLERCSSKAVPYIFPVHCSSHLQSNLQVSTLDSEVESSLLILHKVKCDLGVTLLLQISDDALSDEITVSDDLENFIVVPSNESELEAVLCWVDVDRAGLGCAIKAVDDLTFYSGEVDWLIQSLDDTVIAGCQV
jgi:hypothetical protein